MPKRGRNVDVEELPEEARLQLEALLFSSENPLDAKRLIKALGLRSERSLEKLVAMLKEEYDKSNRAFTISRLPGNKYMMHLRPTLTSYVRRHLGRPSLSKALMRTLSFIAYHQPIQRPTVAAVRGSRSYAQIRTLIERGLVVAERKGKTVVLRTTPLFADLLGVEDSPAAIRRRIEEMMGTVGVGKEAERIATSDAPSDQSDPVADSSTTAKKDEI